jgi:hypothetical protein
MGRRRRPMIHGRPDSSRRASKGNGVTCGDSLLHVLHWSVAYPPLGQCEASRQTDTGAEQCQQQEP